MQDGLQAGARAFVGKDQAPHAATIESTVGRRHLGAKGGEQRRHGCAAGGGQLMGDDICIDHVDAFGGRVP